MSMKPVNDTLKLTGNTPVYQIGDSNVFVKLEKYNAGGSVKVRAVYGITGRCFYQDSVRFN